MLQIREAAERARLGLMPGEIDYFPDPPKQSAGDKLP